METQFITVTSITAYFTIGSLMAVTIARDESDGIFFAYIVIWPLWFVIFFCLLIREVYKWVRWR